MAARSRLTPLRASLSRRALVGAGLAGAALGWRGGTGGRAAQIATPTPSPASDPATWQTWLLTAADELRPPPPAAPSAAEIAELRQLQAERTVATEQTVEAWGSGPAVLPWAALALDLIRVHQPSPVRAGRALALLHTAFADTVLATWDAQEAYPRPTPAALLPDLVPLDDASAGPSSFPSVHAALAGAAETVLAYLFPAEPASSLQKLADEASMSRLWAGTNFRSEVEAGRQLGRTVGARAVAHGRADGSDQPWDGKGRPAGDGVWQSTPPAYVQQPLDPTAGRWTPWVLASGNQYRPSAPPPYGSPGWQAELGAVQEAVTRRTPDQVAAARSWAGTPGTVTPAGLWIERARDLILQGGLDLPHAARVLALVSVAMADALLCCWDAKYTYWTERPITADSGLAVLLPTPPFPSYTSGHATVSAAAATVLAHLFPAAATTLTAEAAEAAASRVWAGIHFAIDSDQGGVGGNLVGRLVVARARADGAEHSPSTT